MVTPWAWDKHGGLHWPLRDNKRYQAMHLRQWQKLREESEIKRQEKEKQMTKRESLGHNKRSSEWQNDVNEKRQRKVVRGQGVRRSRGMEMKEHNRRQKRWRVRWEKGINKIWVSLLDSVVSVHQGRFLALILYLPLERFEWWFWTDDIDKPNQSGAGHAKGSETTKR